MTDQHQTSNPQQHLDPGIELVESPCALCGETQAVRCAAGTDFEYDTTDHEFQFVQCQSCAHQYLKPRPAPSEMDRIYPSNYYSFVGTRNRLVARLQRLWESRKVKLYRGWIGEGPRRVLDVGCGDGRFLELLRDFGSPEWRLGGLESDADAVERCREKGFDAHTERVEEFALKEEERNQYDAVIMLQLLEHVEDPSRIADQVFQLLRKGGLFVIETPHLGGLDYALFQGRHWGHYHFPRHFHLFSEATLRDVLEKNGFEIVAHEFLISTSSWIISAHNYLKDRGWPAPIWRFFSYQNPILLALAVGMDTLRIRLGQSTSNQRVLARRPPARAERSPAPHGRKDDARATLA